MCCSKHRSRLPISPHACRAFSLPEAASCANVSIIPRRAPVYAVEVRDHIMIAHSFKGAVFGPAQALHGATFVIDAAFMAETLDANSIVIDIGRAHEALKAILAPLNYKNLDTVKALDGRNTTTEV